MKLSVSKGIMMGAIMAIVIAVLILTYTNTFEVLKPEVESSIDTAKDAISKVDGKEVVEKAEETTEKIKSVTEKIKITDP